MAEAVAVSVSRNVGAINAQVCDEIADNITNIISNPNDSGENRRSLLLGLKGMGFEINEEFDPEQEDSTVLIYKGEEVQDGDELVNNLTYNGELFKFRDAESFFRYVEEFYAKDVTGILKSQVKTEISEYTSWYDQLEAFFPAKPSDS